MRILDRYIGGLYLLALASCAATLAALYVVIDIFTRLDDFMTMETSGLLRFILGYYACRVPQFMIHGGPVVTLTAAVLCLVRFARQNELVPMVSSGTSAVRVLAPILLVGCLVTGATMAVEEYLLPRIAGPVRSSKDALQHSDDEDNKIVRDSRNNVLVARHYDPKGRRMTNLTLLQTGAAGGLILEVNAKSARWSPEEGGSWIASDGAEYVFDREGKRLAQRTFGADGKRLVTEITPEAMIREREDGEFLTFAQLKRKVEEHPFEASLRVRLHEKLTFPLFNLILLGLGIPLMLRRGVRNPFIGSGICMVVCAVFFATFFFFSDLGSKGELDPVLAMWLPVVVFGGLAIWLFDTIPT